MTSRLELQAKLEELLGSEQVYYQPPESIKMSYPAIVYSKSRIETKKANNSTVDGVSFRYAIEKVEKKDKDPEYKGVKFKEVLAKLAFNNLFK